MGKGIRVPFVADVRKFISGTDRIEDSLDDVADSLDKLTAEGDAVERQLESNFRDIAADARTQFRKVGKAADDGFDQVRRSGKAAEAGREVGGEFAQNFGESVRSGDPAGALVETVTSLGPAFGAAGVALAAAFGIGKALVDEANKSKARLKAAGKTAFNALRDGVIEAQEQEDTLVDVLGADDIADAMKRAKKEAKNLGVATSDVVAFIVSGGRVATPALTAALARADAETAKLKGNADAAEGNLSAAATSAGNVRKAAELTTTAYEEAGSSVLALDGGLQKAAGKALTLAQRAAEFESSAKNSASYWSSIERSLTRAGWAAPGQVRAERAERGRYP